VYQPITFFKKYLSYLGAFRGPPVEKRCSIPGFWKLGRGFYNPEFSWRSQSHKDKIVCW